MRKAVTTTVKATAKLPFFGIIDGITKRTPRYPEK